MLIYFSITIALFTFTELILFIGTTCITSSIILGGDYSLREYLRAILDNLIYEGTYIYPLSAEYKDDLTIVGRVFFSILWFIFWGLPFILGNILAFPICAFTIAFKKIMFKSPNDENDQYHIDH